MQITPELFKKDLLGTNGIIYANGEITIHGSYINDRVTEKKVYTNPIGDKTEQSVGAS